jgi:DNA-binding response OmpR family regulator
VKDSQEPVLDAALSVYLFEDFRLDNAARTVTSPKGEKLDLTSAEFDVLRTFMERPNRTITRVEIIENTHNRMASDPFDRSVDVLISRLRKKLEEAGGRADLLKTVRNSGYQFTARIHREESSR